MSAGNQSSRALNHYHSPDLTIPFSSHFVLEFLILAAVSVNSVIAASIWQLATIVRLAYMQTLCPGLVINPSLSWLDDPMYAGYMVRLNEAGPRAIRAILPVCGLPRMDEKSLRRSKSLITTTSFLFKTLDSDWIFKDAQGNTVDTPNLLLESGSSEIPVALVPLFLHVAFVSDM